MYYPQPIHNKVHETILAEEDIDRFKALYPPIKKTSILKSESRKRKIEENCDESKKSRNV